MFKKTSCLILSTSILVSGISSVLGLEKTVYAENNVEDIYLKDDVNVQVSEKDIELANVIKDYVKLQSKNGIYQYDFRPDNSLELRLQSLGADFTVSDLSELVANINLKLKEENGYGELTSTLHKLRYEKNNNYINYDSTQFRAPNACNVSMLAVGTGHSLLLGYTAMALGVAGPAGLLIPAAVGLAYGVGSLWCP